MTLLRAVFVGMALVGFVGCGGKPAAPPAESAKFDPPAAKQNEPPQAETAPMTKAEPQKATSVTDGKTAGDVRDDNGLKMSFSWCPPGSFMMGSPANESERFDNEDQVQVTLTKGFWLGRTEVSQSQWKTTMGTERWKGRDEVKEGADFPATCVSWEDANSFCRTLTEKERSGGGLPEGWEYRLPTEAEREWACRAGTPTAYSFGDDPSKLGEYGWTSDNTYLVGELYAHAVGLKKPNPWGLHDMHGNVSEWCSDFYGEKLPGGTDPQGAKIAPNRAFRGGSWYESGRYCRSARRYEEFPQATSSTRGFRVALAPVRAAKAE